MFKTLFLSIFLFLSLSISATEKEWTLLIFINGNNNLDSFATLNLNQMEKVGSTETFNAVVQWASYRAKTTKRMLMIKDNSSKVTSPVIQDLPRVDMGNYQSLIDFIHWGVKNYPAKHYMIDVWNHGGGWMKSRSLININNISYDDFSGNSISTPELGLVMKDASELIGHKVDVYASDACLMAMVEVASEMADYVDYFGGSEKVEPGDGWTYDTLFNTIKPNTSPKQMLINVTDTYIAHYPSSVTFSAFDLSYTKELEQAIADFVPVLLKQDVNKVTSSAENALRFDISSYADLGDFLNLLNIPETKNLQQVISKYVFYNKTLNYPDATGISIWLPLRIDNHMNAYKNLLFTKHTNWDDVINFIQ